MSDESTKTLRNAVIGAIKAFAAKPTDIDWLIIDHVDALAARVAKLEARPSLPPIWWDLSDEKRGPVLKIKTPTDEWAELTMTDIEQRVAALEAWRGTFVTFPVGAAARASYEKLDLSPPDPAPDREAELPPGVAGIAQRALDSILYTSIPAEWSEKLREHYYSAIFSNGPFHRAQAEKAIISACREYAASVERERDDAEARIKKYISCEHSLIQEKAKLQADLAEMEKEKDQAWAAHGRELDTSRALQADLAALRERAVPTEDEIDSRIAAMPQGYTLGFWLHNWLSLRSRLEGGEA